MLFGSMSGAVVKEVEKMLREQSGSLLVDVRSPSEYASGHAPGAKNVPFGTIDEKVMEDLKFASTVYVICQSGSRSSIATQQFTKHGVNAINVFGGMQAWKQAGLPIE